MTGSALKRWTLYRDCFSERISWNWEGVQGGGSSKFDRIARDTDFFGGFKSMAGAAFSLLLRKIRILDVLKT